MENRSDLVKTGLTHPFPWMSGNSKKLEAVGRVFFLFPTNLGRSKKTLLAGYQFISSLANVSTTVLQCRVFNRKSVTVDDMSVDRKLLERSGPRDYWDRISEDVTFEISIPVLVSNYRTFWFCDKFRWYWKYIEKKNKKIGNTKITARLFFVLFYIPPVTFTVNY